MTELDLLPATTYKAVPPEQAQGRYCALNTIMEDDEESTRGPPTARFQREGEPSRIAHWLSPLSDHFPTPRGNHFMSAPYIPSLPSSPSSASGSESSHGFSAPPTRDSFGTQATEFDDLYDVSSDEEDWRKKTAPTNTSTSKKTATPLRLSTNSAASRSSLPALIIPFGQSHWDNISAFKKLTSPVPPTPPPKVPMSPAIFRYLSSQEVPSSSAPPSLDGSVTSEQMAAMSAPPTPDIGNDEDEDANGWGGVQLQPAAMATLQALSGDEIIEPPIEQVIEFPQISPTREMQQSPPPVHTNIRRNNSIVLPPDQQRCLNSLTKLEIPSPGGLFSSHAAGTRHTWHLVPITPLSAHLPSSTTAEHFYKTPWSSVPVERFVDVPETTSEGCPTARPTLVQKDSDATVTGLETVAEEELVATEILADYETGYRRQLQDAASENIGWTTMWLSAQTTYLSDLINPKEARDDEVALQRRNTVLANIVEEQKLPDVSSKKTVRFSEIPTSNAIAEVIGCPLPKLGRQESAYYRSFQQFANRSRYRDTFVHSIPRFEALQAQRVNFHAAHINQLLGKYQLSVVPLSPKKRISANVARGDELTLEDPAKLKIDKEREAKEQLSAAYWNVMAIKMLNGNRLISAPIEKKLKRRPRVFNGTPRDRARILDLGGQTTCDWAWQCATEYPNTKVYTVTTKCIRQLSNSNIQGPGNHRQVAVEKLVKLPFKNDQFDLISARHLYSILKVSSENGADEYVECLKECMRCLKPGGYFEFSLLDSDIINAGALGQAKSVEFGLSLKTRGYDATPTKSWLGKLHKAGFINIKRAWLFLPMGAPLAPKPDRRDSMGVEVSLELEAMITGSSNAVASVTGLVGSWAWEKWMLKLQVESGCVEQELLEGVHGIVEEGRQCGAGWRMLNGWARKPQTI